MVPANDTAWPMKSSRKSRKSRSGEMSTATVRTARRIVPGGLPAATMGGSITGSGVALVGGCSGPGG
jgi:hypothetical protein